ncbi:MAG: hypothetical protein WBV82_09915 [Myxococcaceae bacterium]
MSNASSALLIDEFFEAGDDRFLEEVLRSDSDKKLKSLAERWYRDARPFARRMLCAYVEDGCDHPGHRGLVKALFKLAEAAGDDELMGHFLVAFDRLVKRELVKRSGWDWQTRQSYNVWVLRNDSTVPARARRQGSYSEPKRSTEGYILHQPLPRFSRVTRQYLQRRTWRYFRTIGRKDPARYGRIIRAALAKYEDTNLTKPERIIDAWGLMHALYHGSSVLVRKPRGITVAEGAKLAELRPAPYLPEAWLNVRDELLTLLLEAKSRTVRSFVISTLEASYADELRGLEIARVRQLLAHPHEEVQSFGVKLLQTATGLESLPIKAWLELLELDNPMALPLLCELVQKTVSPDRLSLDQCLALAMQRAAPVAELGLHWAKKKPIRSADDLRYLVRLARAEALNVRAEAIDWVCQLLLVADDPKPELVRELLDSPHADVRRHALALMTKDRRFGEDTLLWAAMAESPYDDIRQALLRELEPRERSFAPQTLQHLWATAILSVHRGGRAKRQIADQLAERIIRKPAETDVLLPLLGYALRSIRLSERRSALASLSKAAFRRPALREAIALKLPELKFIGDEVAS